jgi:hypothetical protein
MALALPGRVLFITLGRTRLDSGEPLGLHSFVLVVVFLGYLTGYWYFVLSLAPTIAELKTA